MTADVQRELAEIWRPVVDYEGFYEVSSHGRVRSLPRRNTAGGIRKLTLNSRGYLTVTLHANGVGTSHRVHVLVASAWHAPRPEGQDCRHLNDDKLDNRPENLAWGTRSENLMDAIRNGIHYLANRETCEQGHEWTPENTRWVAKAGSRPYRRCRSCQRRKDRAARAANQARYGVTRRPRQDLEAAS